MSIPAPPVEVPGVVRRVAGGDTVTPVWRNGRGGLAFRLGDGGPGVDRFVKIGPRNLETSMAGEADRLTWAVAWTPVPRVLEVGGDAGSEWLVTRALEGRSAVDPRWIAEPDAAVRAIGEGLRALHEALPFEECPFDWSVATRAANAARRGIRVPDTLRDPPPVDRLVVCHGDACSPNTLIGDDGRWTGHVDLDALGVADRWADIAVAAMSATWNFGPGWEAALLDAYGVAPDPARLAYYRDLWNAT